MVQTARSHDIRRSVPMPNQSTPEQRERNRQRAAAWRVAHPERVKASRQRYSESRREELSLKQQAYYREHRASVIERMAGYRETHSDRLRAERAANAQRRQASAAAWRTANPDRVKANARAWQLANPERTRNACRNRYGMRKAATIAGPVDYAAIIARDGLVCKLCGGLVDPLIRWPHPMSKSFDHIIPLDKGGAHAEWNLQLAHLRCNSRKGATLKPGQMALPL